MKGTALQGIISNQQIKQIQDGRFVRPLPGSGVLCQQSGCCTGTCSGATVSGKKRCLPGTTCQPIRRRSGFNSHTALPRPLLGIIAVLPHRAPSHQYTTLHTYGMRAMQCHPPRLTPHSCPASPVLSPLAECRVIRSQVVCSIVVHTSVPGVIFAQAEGQQHRAWASCLSTAQ